MKYATPLAAIDAALDEAHALGVSIRTDAVGVLDLISDQAASTRPLDPTEGFSVEIGSAGYRAWSISVSQLEISTSVADNEPYTEISVPAGATVELVEDGRGGRRFTFDTEG